MEPSQPWIDITVTTQPGMVVWPGDPPVSLQRVRRIDDGDHANVSHIAMSVHTGTHMDGLNHFVNGAAGIDAMPLEAVVGPARVIAIEDPHSITIAELAPHKLQRAERLLFKTRNSARPWFDEPFWTDYVAIPQETAQYLVDCGVQTVGVDYLSIGRYQGDGVETHQIMLGAGIWVIEGLYLAAVEPGLYEFIALPIKLKDSDGAPCRAILRPLTSQ
ncbi:MAG: cyclase family protein [Chloroflexaceae bacterium]|nr:cyclase family protein [Chloroflexaceae bacterium]